MAIRSTTGNREEKTGQARSNIKALTVKGEFHAITEPAEKDAIRVRFQKQHPHLMGFLNDHDTEVFSIKIESLQLLDGVTDTFFETVK